MSATFREVDETVERDLFDRRARALGDPRGVPSLEDVLRAADEHGVAAVPVPGRVKRDESHEPSGAMRRAWSGLALAAACVIAVMKTVPHAPPAPIAADVAVRAPAPVVVGVGVASSEMSEEGDVNTCSLESPAAAAISIAPSAPAAPDDHPCPDAIRAAQQSAPTLSCEREEANRSEMP